MSDPLPASMRRRNRRTLLSLAVVAVGMVGLAYASVPLYRIFCQVTGYGGTTQRADAVPKVTSERVMTVRFDANASSSLGWKFEPVEREVTVRLGEQRLIFYRATNLTNRTLVGTATFNVTPLKAGSYFNKLECFCFTEQTLAAGQTVDMPVSFFIDPDMAEDVNAKEVHTVTLSYTFFPVKRDGDNLRISEGRPVTTKPAKAVVQINTGA